MSELSTALQHLQTGRMIILVDDEDRENEGDLVLAAEFVTPAAINFMAREACGLICLAMSDHYIDRLSLPPMTTKNKSRWASPFTVSIEARHGITTGISAHDRAHTIKVAIDDASTSQDVVSPGHMFPLRANGGGVLARPGHTEGSVDLMQLAGLKPAAVICEVMNADGSMARATDLRAFGEKHDMPIITIRDIIEHRLATEAFRAAV